MRANSALLTLAAGLALATGCQHPMENPFFTVKESGLNWVDVREYRVQTTPPLKIRVRLDGNGIVTVRAGQSPLVGNPFAKEFQSQHWNDIQETRLTIPREEALFLFQTLVDRGLFVKQDKPTEELLKGDLVYVSANIQNKTAGSSDPVTDPDLIEHLKMLVMMFYHPTPARKR